MYAPYGKPRRSSFFLPFLILVAAGIIVVLGFKMYGTFFPAKMGQEISFYIAQGEAKVQTFGIQEWQKAYHGSKILQGDSLKTGVDSYGVIQFFNGTTVRMDQDTSMTIQRVRSDDDEDSFQIALQRGQVWVNVPSADKREKPIRFLVETPKTVIRARGTIFASEVRDQETVRVMRESVETDIMALEGDAKKVLATLTVGVGQQITLGEKEYQKFIDRESPSLLSALDDTFKQTPFFTWNSQEDFQPTNFATAEPKSAGALSIATVMTEPPPSEGDGKTPLSGASAGTPLSGAAKKLPAPVITEPAPDKRTVTNPLVKILGTVPEGSVKVTVTWRAGAQTLPITLSKFKAGDKTFQYGAQESYNLAAGENHYTVVAYDKDGNASEPAEIVITYKK